MYLCNVTTKYVKDALTISKIVKLLAFIIMGKGNGMNQEKTCLHIKSQNKGCASES